MEILLTNFMTNFIANGVPLALLAVVILFDFLRDMIRR